MAQSSFTWMLEPDQSPSTSSPPSSATPTTATTVSSSSRRSPRDSASRERNAFLFGEVTASGAADLAKGGGAGAGGRPAFTPDDIFGLEPLRKPAKPRGKYEDLFGGTLSED